MEHRRLEAEKRQEETERKLLEQRLATQAAEGRAERQPATARPVLRGPLSPAGPLAGT